MKRTVLIADGDFVLAKKLSRALEGTQKFQVIDVALNGEQAIHMVEERKPDILVMDIMLTVYDGLSVLEQISSVTPRPIVIASSLFISNYVTMAAMDLGVRQLIKKPWDMKTMVASIERACYKLPRSGTADNRKHLIANTLHDVGIPANIKGYIYLIDALEIAIMDGEAPFAMTTAIYAPIAEQYEIKPKQVQRAITRAVDISWDRGDLDTLESYFGYTISNARGKPTNGEFVSLIAEKLRFQLEYQGIEES